MATPVLMYHAVTDADERSIPTAELPYAVTMGAFREQMSFLKNHGIETRALTDTAKPAGRSVVLTFDDGHDTDSENALPCLLENGHRAEFYITTGWIGEERYMNADDIRKLDEAGMIVGTHGITHRYFDDLSEVEFRREMQDSKSRLEDIVGHAVTCGSAPGGRLHEGTRRIAVELGYDYLCTSEVGIANIPRASGFELVPRLVVGRTTTLLEFENLVSGSQKTILVRQAKAGTLKLAKRVLGNRRYDRLRARLLGGEN